MEHHYFGILSLFKQKCTANIHCGISHIEEISTVVLIITLTPLSTATVCQDYSSVQEDNNVIK